MKFEYDAEEPEPWPLDWSNVMIHVHHHIGEKAERA